MIKNSIIRSLRISSPNSSLSAERLVDLVSQRRNSTYVNLDSDSLNDLNEFFALLCSDDGYVPPSDVVIAHDVEIPQITEKQVWNILAKLKRTATGTR